MVPPDAGYLGHAYGGKPKLASGYAHALLKKVVWTEEDRGAFRMLVIPFGKVRRCGFNLALAAARVCGRR